MSETARPPAKRENLLLNLVFSVVIPVVVLSYLSKPERLGVAPALIVALIFPIGYGIYDYVQRKKLNLISLLGFISVLLTGGFGLFKLSAEWFAVKEAAIPAVIALGLLFSMRAKEPLIKALIFNEAVLNLERVDSALRERGNLEPFGRLMRQCTLIVAVSFFLSSALNYILARRIIHSVGGTVQFNEELGRMHWVSLLVIALPCTIMMMLAFWRLLTGLKKLTGLETDDLLATPPAKK